MNSAEGSDCPSGKEQFATREAAREKALALRAMGRAANDLKPYRCDLCGCVHIGHRQSRRKEKLRKRKGIR